VAQGFTGETNNLSFGPTSPAASQPGPAVEFSESSAGGAASDCAAATTIGDTHLRTFNGLLYDFQASGDFLLAQAKNFTVQSRQVSGAPTWPDAAVNQAVAAQVGKSRVAFCTAPSRLVINGHPAALVYEGQGSLMNPAYPGGFELLAAGRVRCVVMQHAPARKEYDGFPNFKMDPLEKQIAAVELVSRAKVVAVTVNHENMNLIDVPAACADIYGGYEGWRVKLNASLLAPCGDKVSPAFPASPSSPATCHRTSATGPGGLRQHRRPRRRPVRRLHHRRRCARQGRRWPPRHAAPVLDKEGRRRQVVSQPATTLPPQHRGSGASLAAGPSDADLLGHAG
jgi:hypothetical protein